MLCECIAKLDMREISLGLKANFKISITVDCKYFPGAQLTPRGTDVALL